MAFRDASAHKVERKKHDFLPARNLFRQVRIIGLVKVCRVDMHRDIFVIDRAQCPGGMPVRDFFVSARRLAAHPKVRLVDLTEFDPSLDVGDITALTAGRWVCEVLAGYASRGR